MAFKMLLSHPSVQEQVSHRIHEIFQTYKGKHHLYLVPNPTSRGLISASFVADLIRSDKKVYVLTRSKKEDVILKVFAGLTEYKYKDIKNPNFRNKMEVQEKIEEVSRRYDSMIEIDTYLPGNNFKKITSMIEEKLLVFKADYVIIEDLQALGDESDYAKQMNQAVTSLCLIAENSNVSVLSFSATAYTEDVYLPGYMQNSNLLVTKLASSENSPEIVQVRQGKTETLARIMENLSFFVTNKDKEKILFVYDQYHNSGEYLHKSTRIIVYPPYKSIKKYQAELLKKEPPYNEHEVILPSKLEKELLETQFKSLKEVLDLKIQDQEVDYEKIRQILSELSDLSKKISKI